MSSSNIIEKRNYLMIIREQSVRFFFFVLLPMLFTPSDFRSHSLEQFHYFLQ